MILREHGPLPVADAVDIALDVCDELANAHANGVVHGDLGLHRVRTFWPRVPGQSVDIFALEENDTAAFKFRAAAFVGLIAPEKRRGLPVDPRADVWAVGVLLHWMITGQAPSSDAPDVERLLWQAPRPLVGTMRACLSVEPDGRPASVTDLASALAHFAASPNARFEQLAAARRAAEERTKYLRTDNGDLDRVLGRLDDAAYHRAVSAAGEPLVIAASVISALPGLPIAKPKAMPVPPSVETLPASLDEELHVTTVATRGPSLYDVDSDMPLTVKQTARMGWATSFLSHGSGQAGLRPDASPLHGDAGASADGYSSISPVSVPYEPPPTPVPVYAPQYASPILPLLEPRYAGPSWSRFAIFGAAMLFGLGTALTILRSENPPPAPSVAAAQPVTPPSRPREASPIAKASGVLATALPDVTSAPIKTSGVAAQVVPATLASAPAPRRAPRAVRGASSHGAATTGPSHSAAPSPAPSASDDVPTSREDVAPANALTDALR